MQNFEFLVPTRVIFGKGSHERAGQLALRHDATKVMIHYGGGSVKRSGLFDQVYRSLESVGISWIEFGGVVPNPRLSKVYEGIELARSEDVDFLLALGGGSVIDSAKGIAAGLANPESDVWDFYTGEAELEQAAPLGVILTLAASGSETSKSSVVSRDSDGLKRPINNEVIRPRFAVMNPELTYTLPPYQTACGVVDIMSHVLERYLSAEPGGDVTGEMCEGLLRAVIKNGRILIEDPANYDARAEVLWAGSVAHSDILGVGRIPDWASHRIEHEITRLTDIAHGAGLAVIFPAMMKFLLKDELERLTRLAVSVWGVSHDSGTETQVASGGIARMESFFRSLGMPVTLADAGIGVDLISNIAQSVQRSPDGRVGGYRRLTEKDITEMLNLANKKTQTNTEIRINM